MQRVQLYSRPQSWNSVYLVATEILNSRPLVNNRMAGLDLEFPSCRAIVETLVYLETDDDTQDARDFPRFPVTRRRRQLQKFGACYVYTVGSDLVFTSLQYCNGERTLDILIWNSLTNCHQKYYYTFSNKYFLMKLYIAYRSTCLYIIVTN